MSERGRVRVGGLEGLVDRGAGFTGRINVIKCKSISRSGGEAWQIPPAYGLIKESPECDCT